MSIDTELFDPTPEHAMLRETVRRFAEAEVELAAAEETARMAALMIEFEEEMHRRAEEAGR